MDIQDFTKSWSDGLAFNALIHRYRPSLFDFNELLYNSPEKNLEHAFRIAHKHLKIERLLDVEGMIKYFFSLQGFISHCLIILIHFFIILFLDVMSDNPDKKSIMMYVMCYFQVLSQPEVIIEEAKHVSNDVSFQN